MKALHLATGRNRLGRQFVYVLKSPLGKATRMSTDESRIERFCADAYPQLVAALTHHCGDVHLAEELAQEALIKASQRWDRVQGLESPVGWCYRVAVNASNSWFRRKRIERRAGGRLSNEQQTNHRDPDGADAVAVRRALGELTDQQREAVICRYFLDLSSEQTARLLDSTAGAVRALTHRALKTLRDVLDDDLDLDQEAADVS